MVLLAPRITEVAPAELAREMRGRFGQELRRLGVYTQLCLLGAENCLAAAGGSGRLGVLVATAHGALSAARAALDDGLRQGQPVMPFTFIATQTSLAGALLAKGSHDVRRAACVYPAAQDWPWVLRMARGWLSGCERVLLGWVEEAAEGAPHRSHWCLLARAGGPIRCEPCAPTGAAAAAADWLSRVAEWQEAAAAPLELRGGNAGWRFTRA